MTLSKPNEGYKADLKGGDDKDKEANDHRYNIYRRLKSELKKLGYGVERAVLPDGKYTPGEMIIFCPSNETLSEFMARRSR